jgi:hypothetical protein
MANNLSCDNFTFRITLREYSAAWVESGKGASINTSDSIPRCEPANNMLKAVRAGGSTSQIGTVKKVLLFPPLPFDWQVDPSNNSITTMRSGDVTTLFPVSSHGAVQAPHIPLVVRG